MRGVQWKLRKKHGERSMAENNVVQIYCENADCSVRECEVTLKNHDNEPSSWFCPGCGSQATIHWRRTASEHRRIELQEAIAAVK